MASVAAMFVTFTIQPVEVDHCSTCTTRTQKLQEVLEQAGLQYRIGPMGTVVEGEWDEIMAAIRQCRDASVAQHMHVVTTIVVDDQTDGPRDIDEAVDHAKLSLWRAARGSGIWSPSVDRDF